MQGNGYVSELAHLVSSALAVSSPPSSPTTHNPAASTAHTEPQQAAHSTPSTDQPASKHSLPQSADQNEQVAQQQRTTCRLGASTVRVREARRMVHAVLTTLFTNRIGHTAASTLVQLLTVRELFVCCEEEEMRA